MRKPLIAGNWKMNKMAAEAKSLLEEIKTATASFSEKVDVMIAPSSLYLAHFGNSAGSQLAIGAQDVSAQQEDGAFTGEFSAAMLKSAGVKHAIVGHSERRTYHGEDDALISQKIKACVAAGIVPVYCCGENLEQREANKHVAVVTGQLKTALEGMTSMELANLVVAYEPVWAIGTGKTASAAQAQEMHHEIRNFLSTRFDQDFAAGVRILYGGSCKPSNAAELLSQPDVDGGLIGGASLVAGDFAKIVEAAAQ